MEQFQSMSYEEIAIWIDTKARLEIISHFYTFKETVFVSVISRDNVKMSMSSFSRV